MSPKINFWLHHCFVPHKIPGYFSSSGEFRCVSAVNLFRAGTRWMSFFFFFWYLHIFIFGVLDDHDSPNFSLLDHPSLLLPSFNRPDGSGVLSFLLFSFQRATPNFLYILERQSPILFLKSETSFYFLVKRVNVLGHAPQQSLLFCFSSRPQMDHVHLLYNIKFWHLMWYRAYFGVLYI